MSDTPACARIVTRALPLAAMGGIGIAFVAAGGARYLTLAALAQHREALLALLRMAGTLAPLGFIALYAGLTALSVPGAAMMSIAAGFLFGIWAGTLYAAVGATLGATAFFAAARAGFGNLADRAGPRLRRLEAGFRADAMSYLLMLRLIPVFPFWLVNLVAAIARVKLRTYVVTTFVGITPGCLVFVSLGNGLDQIIAAGRAADASIMLRPTVWLPLVGLGVLALLPVAYRRLRV
jgi:uncharacterized membrane protein YdjX (TVP38/TMEM64 family)